MSIGSVLVGQVRNVSCSKQEGNYRSPKFSWAAVVFFIFPVMSCASTDPNNTEKYKATYEAVSAQTPWIKQQGIELRKIPLGEGVVRYEVREGDKIKSHVTDETGLGNVQCQWIFAVTFRAELEICDTTADGLKRQLSSTIENMNAYIVNNSFEDVFDIENTSRAKLGDAVSKAVSLRSERYKGLAPEEARRQCKRLMSESDIPAFIDAIKRSISVPRPSGPPLFCL